MIARLRALAQLEAARFVVAGGINTVVSLVIYWGLLTVLPYGAAYTGGFIVGVFTAFTLNTYFVFRTEWSWKKLAAFPGIQGANYLLGLVFLWLLVHAIGVPPSLAPLISIPATIPFNFLMTRVVMRGRGTVPVVPPMAAPAELHHEDPAAVPAADADAPAR